jgi:hypothetical protein
MTNHHTDPDATPTSQDPFWNDDADWTPSSFERRSSQVSVGAGATVARWWDSLLGGDAPAGRAHGAPASASRRANAGGAASSPDDGSWLIEPRSRGTRSGALDPKVARIGGFIVAVTVAVPLILGFTSSPDDDTLKTAEAASTTTITPITIVTIPPIDANQSDTTAAADAPTSDSDSTLTRTRTRTLASPTTPPPRLRPGQLAHRWPQPRLSRRARAKHLLQPRRPPPRHPRVQGRPAATPTRSSPATTGSASPTRPMSGCRTCSP